VSFQGAHRSPPLGLCEELAERPRRPTPCSGSSVATRHSKPAVAVSQASAPPRTTQAGGTYSQKGRAALPRHAPSRMSPMIGTAVVSPGRVRGVGFRYTTQRIAARFPVAGHVRTLPGGDVELAAEGEAGDVEAFLDAVANQMAGYIERSTVHDEPVRGWSGFSIRH